MEKKILRLPVVIERSGISRSTIYKKIKTGTFPAPLKLGERAIGWLEVDIDNYLSSLKEKTI